MCAILHIVYFTINLLLHVSTQLPSSGSLNQRSEKNSYQVVLQ